MGQIITPSDVITAMPDLTPQQQSGLNTLCDDLTDIIQNYCNTVFVPTNFDEVYYPGRTMTIRLNNTPVIDVTWVAAVLTPVLTVYNNDANILKSTVHIDTSGDPTNLTLSGITLTSETNGVPAAPVTLSFATYITMSQLVAAINAVPGWVAACPENMGSWATARVLKENGARGAEGAGTALYSYTEEIHDYVPDLIDGTLTLPTWGLLGMIPPRWYPDTFRFPDRAWGPEQRYGGIRVQYQAGYATIPPRIRRAALLWARYLLLEQQYGGYFHTVRLGDFSMARETLRRGMPPSIEDLLFSNIRIQIA